MVSEQHPWLATFKLPRGNEDPGIWAKLRNGTKTIEVFLEDWTRKCAVIMLCQGALQPGEVNESKV